MKDFKALCGSEVLRDVPAQHILVIFNGQECKDDEKVRELITLLTRIHREVNDFV